ncbi:hypothetical protein F443_18317, partial [Phytophthora nicotianae P1569]
SKLIARPRTHTCKPPRHLQAEVQQHDHRHALSGYNDIAIHAASFTLFSVRFYLPITTAIAFYMINVSFDTTWINPYLIAYIGEPMVMLVEQSWVTWPRQKECAM